MPEWKGRMHEKENLKLLGLEMRWECSFYLFIYLFIYFYWILSWSHGNTAFLKLSVKTQHFQFSNSNLTWSHSGANLYSLSITDHCLDSIHLQSWCRKVSSWMLFKSRLLQRSFWLHRFGSRKQLLICWFRGQFWKKR